MRTMLSGSHSAAERCLRVELATLVLYPLLELRERRRPDLSRWDCHSLEVKTVVGVYDVADAPCRTSKEVQDIARLEPG